MPVICHVSDLETCTDGTKYYVTIEKGTRPDVEKIEEQIRKESLALL